MFIGSRAPFGYLKDPNDRHHLIIDPPAADVVREIFRMFADGIGYVRMTKILRERGILNKLYEDMALERISEERYQAMAPGYEREQEVLRGRREELAAEIAHSMEVYENIEKFLPVIWKYTDITELNAHILNELIEKIVVHEKEVDQDGIKSQRVDIYYKFIGYVDLRQMMKNGAWSIVDTPEGPKVTKIKPAC